MCNLDMLLSLRMTDCNDRVARLPTALSMKSFYDEVFSREEQLLIFVIMGLWLKGSVTTDERLVERPRNPSSPLE